MTPPIPDRLFAESCMELVEGHRKLLRSFLPSLLIKRPLIEEGALLGIGGEARQAHRYLTESDSTTDTSVKEGREVRRQLHFPTGLRHPFLLHDGNLITVADGDGQTSTQEHHRELGQHERHHAARHIVHPHAPDAGHGSFPLLI